MKNKKIIRSAVMAVIIVGEIAVEAAIKPETALPDIKLKGYLGERLDKMIEHHVIGTDVDYITACFQEKTERRRWWQTEFWGKYMHSAVPYSYYVDSSKLKSDLVRGVERVLQSQEPNGYIGNYPDELRCGEGWDVWGMKYTLMGLLHFVDNGKLEGGNEGCELRRRAYDAAKKLCDYVIAEIGPQGKRGRELWTTGNWSGYASSSILEPVVWLYRRVKEREGADVAAKYLAFADYIVKGMIEPETGPRLLDLALKGVSVADRNGYGNQAEKHGRYVMKHNRWKAYEMMSCYQGLLNYVEEKVKVEGEDEELKRIRRAAIMTAEDIVKEEINLAGGCASSEAWFHGAKKQHLPYTRLQETCVTTTWMRFCQKLLEMTDDPKWADQLERTFYNAYLAAMKMDGTEFEPYTPLSGSRYHGMHHCFMHTDCCTANGPRGFLCFLREFFTVRDDKPTFNFYSSSLVRGSLSDKSEVAFDMYSLYPRANYVRIVSHTEKARALTLRLRIPAWSAKTKISLNGEELKGVKAGTYYEVAHEWRFGDILEIVFDMPVVAHTLGHHVAFTRGPILLARDNRFADGDFSEPLMALFSDGQLLGNFSEVRSLNDEIWMQFSAELSFDAQRHNPEGALPSTVNFCDFASAGNRWQRGNYYRTWFPVVYGPAE